MAEDRSARQASGNARPGRGVALQNAVAPPLISSDVATKFGELLLRSRWGEERAREQLPLEVEDKGNHWRVIGNARSERADDSFVSGGRFCLLLRKVDGLILDIGIYLGPGGLPE